MGDERENIGTDVSLEEHECVGREELVAGGTGLQD
jgi:hypothetical protein